MNVRNAPIGDRTGYVIRCVFAEEGAVFKPQADAFPNRLPPRLLRDALQRRLRPGGDLSRSKAGRELIAVPHLGLSNQLTKIAPFLDLADDLFLGVDALRNDAKLEVGLHGVAFRGELGLEVLSQCEQRSPTQGRYLCDLLRAEEGSIRRHQQRLLRSIRLEL